MGALYIAVHWKQPCSSSLVLWVRCWPRNDIDKELVGGRGWGILFCLIPSLNEKAYMRTTQQCMYKFWTKLSKRSAHNWMNVWLKWLVGLSVFELTVIIPVKGIRLLDAVRLLLGKDAVPFAAVWSQPGVVCSEKWRLTHWPVDPLTPQGQFWGPPTYTHQVWRRSVRGPRRSRGTNRQTDRQTDKRCSIYSMILACTAIFTFNILDISQTWNGYE